MTQKKKKRHKWKKAKGKRSERERMKEGGREWVALCFSAKGSILNLHIALVVCALRLLSTSRGKGRGDWEGSIGSASPAIVALNMQMNIFYLQCTIMFNRILMRHGPDTCHVNWERNENPRKLNRHGKKRWNKGNLPSEMQWNSKRKLQFYELSSLTKGERAGKEERGCREPVEACANC